MVNYSSPVLDSTFSALADPTRRAILEQLARGDSSVTQLADPFAVSLPAISRHLRVLERAGLLWREKKGRVHRCCLSADRLKEAADWIARYRRFWEKQLAALAHYLDESHDKEESTWPEKAPIPRPRSGSRAPSMRPARRSSKRGRTRRR
jgi:DNA-binding transcriptional ArsR family regulator